MLVPNKSAQPSAVPGTDGLIAERTAKALADYRKLQDARIRATADLERIQQELEGMEASALKEWGTSEPAQLEVIAQRMQQEDLQDITRFEKALEKARTLYAQAEAGAGAQ